MISRAFILHPPGEFWVRYKDPLYTDPMLQEMFGVGLLKKTLNATSISSYFDLFCTIYVFLSMFRDFGL